MIDKAKKQWLDDCKEHLVQATGSAYCAGCKELAQSINSILTELDKMEFLGYTGKNARKARKNKEEKKMATIIRKGDEFTYESEEAQQIAAKIAASDEWSADDCKKLCELADMLKEWEEADGETFESVVYDAAEKLGVEI